MSIFRKDKIHLTIVAPPNEQPRRNIARQTDRRNHSAVKPPDYYSPYGGRRLSLSDLDFFDMGLLRQEDDSFIDRSFEALLAWHGVTVPGVPDPVNVYDKMTTAEWTDYKNFLLNPPGDVELKDAYKKFDYETSDFYYVDVENYQTGDTVFETLPVAKNASLRKLTYKYPETDVTTENWTTDKGLKLNTKKPHLRVKSYGYFEEFDTGNTANFKVTSTPLFTDAAVSFNVAKSHCDLFLVPRLFLEIGSARDAATEGDTFSGRYAYANLLFVQLPRFFKSPQLYPALWGSDGLYFQTNGYPVEQPPDFNVANLPFMVNEGDYQTAFRNHIADTIYGRTNLRMIKSENLAVSGVNMSSAPTVADMSAWATWLAVRGETYERYNRNYNLIQNPSTLFGFEIYGIQNSNINLCAPQAGSLVGVIDQAGTRYYVWAVRENPSYHSSGALQRSFLMNEDRIPPVTGGTPLAYHQWNLR